ncbi:MAG TPA: hypothetical protein VJ732_18205, partial [Bryobacteraceae bacterium]|nr:hypothetical protein [Bryobacteraceae bacterium]
MPNRNYLSARRGLREVALRYTFCGILGFLMLSPEAAGQSALTLQIAATTAPAGGWAQIQVFAATPALIRRAGLSMDLDPTVFGDIAQVAVFSATGDVMGFANVNGRHVDAQFSSASGGIGQLPGVPILEISVPVLAGIPSGTRVPVTLDPAPAIFTPQWQDPSGNPYSVMVTPGRFTVEGNLSVESVMPGGGLLPAGAVLQVSGTGFDSTTTVAMDGVALSAVRLVSPGRIDVTLAAPAELTGKHVRLANAAGEHVDYFASPPSAPANSTPPVNGLHVMAPLRAFAAIEVSNILIGHGGLVALAVLNQNPAPVTVVLEGIGGIGQPSTVLQTGQAVTVPPGELSLVNLNPLLQAAGASQPGSLLVTASAPVRMLEYQQVSANPPQVLTPAPANGATPALTFQLPVSTQSVSWNWQSGTSAPAPQAIQVSSGFGFTASVSGTAWFSASWVAVSPSQATAPATVTLTPNVSGLASGTYTATVTLTPVLPPELSGVTVQPTKIPVSLTVSAQPFLSVPDRCCLFISGPTSGVSPPQPITVASSGGPAPFTVSVAQEDGGSWLSVTPSSGTAPAILTLSVNPAGVSGGPHTATVSIFGPSKTVTLMVQFLVTPPPVNPPAGGLAVSPASLSFTLPSGTTPPASYAQPISVSPPNAAITVSVTASGGNWLRAGIYPPPPFPTPRVYASVDAAGLPAGTYQGAVVIESATAGAVQVPVTFTVLPAFDAGTPLAVMPSSLSLSAPPGQSQTATIQVDSPGRVLFGLTNLSGSGVITSIQVQSSYTSPSGQYSVPASVTITAEAAQPGTYSQSITLESSNSSVTIPVTFTATATPALPPVLSAVVSAASGTAGPIAPGEIIALYGSGIGPAPASYQLDSGGKITGNLSGTQVLINGAPAPVLYVSGSQVNAQVPYEAGTGGAAIVQVIANGIPSAAWGVPLAAAAPALFTLDGSGVGPAAVLNQDNSVNAPANPAPRGTVIQIFATGGGLMSPPAATGGITQSDVHSPAVPIEVT